jgi:hypothetical protein
MKLLPGILLAIGGIYVISKLTTAGSASRLNFTISNLQLGTSGLIPVISLNLLAQNPTNSSFVVQSIVANAFVNGEQVGNVSDFTPVSIGPNSQGSIPLTVLMNAAVVVEDVLNILTGAAGVSAVVSVVGTANISGLVLPVNLSYKII